jgi:hypothetical protein
MTTESPAGRAADDEVQHGVDDRVDSGIDEDVVALAHRLLDLARAGDETLLAYVDAGAPVSLTDAAGNTLLMLASYHGHPTLVAALATRGADVDAANDRGQTPLAGAVFKKDAATVRALLDAGADPDHGRPSARETATFFDNAELLVLLAAGPAAKRAQPRA